MSGGHFDYNQYRIEGIADEIENFIEKKGCEKTQEELKNKGWYQDPSWYEEYPQNKFYPNYPDEVIEKFKEAVELLRKATVYVNRIDYLISGDDGKENFLHKLEEDLNKLKTK
jgi:hypothetical protein